MLKSWEAAYVAGIIDGEGTISFKNIDSKGKRNPVIAITSSDLKMLVFIQSLLSGSLSSKKMMISGQPTYIYTIEIKQKETIREALSQIQQFLRADHKKEEVERVLENFSSDSNRNILRPKQPASNMFLMEKAY
ncbi:hypothetical protein CEY16_09040 [Halalkalibacillus sediminis]|uniref:Homing endonuclease LAGLIDADG domain-containing protein n=1 Tax=Halalkalibacillus sediminis TaxID=2018042 RepID=A0A2I0QUM8_9BACI|nr:LAGLIDADG family homing endonuclease [Halalkalibacillus sediminis]PKR78051.1 hypothetical protein CEY16_09040 [Halalkalibacillus sediminis]